MASAVARAPSPSNRCRHNCSYARQSVGRHGKSHGGLPAVLLGYYGPKVPWFFDLIGRIVALIAGSANDGRSRLAAASLAGVARGAKVAIVARCPIGLHRLAYLAFQDPNRFRSDQMLVIVFNDALVRYISRVLPALGVEDVPVQTFQTWAEQQRRHHIPKLTTRYVEDTPTHVVRMKKHPAMLKAIDQYVAELVERVDAEVLAEA